MPPSSAIDYIDIRQRIELFVVENGTTLNIADDFETLSRTMSSIVHKSLSENARRWNSMNCATRCLPPEVLLRIFAWLNSRGRDHALSVCFHWRTLITTNARLLSTVDLNNPRAINMMLQYVPPGRPTQFFQSRAVDIDYVMDQEDSEHIYPRITDATLLHLRGWYHGETFKWSKPFTQLRELKLVDRRFTFRCPLQWDRIFPSLRILHVTHIRFAENSILFPNLQEFVATGNVDTKFDTGKIFQIFPKASKVWLTHRARTDRMPRGPVPPSLQFFSLGSIRDPDLNVTALPDDVAAITTWGAHNLRSVAFHELSAPLEVLEYLQRNSSVHSLRPSDDTVQARLEVRLHPCSETCWGVGFDYKNKPIPQRTVTIYQPSQPEHPRWWAEIGPQRFLPNVVHLRVELGCLYDMIHATLRMPAVSNLTIDGFRWFQFAQGEDARVSSDSESKSQSETVRVPVLSLPALETVSFRPPAWLVWDSEPHGLRSYRQASFEWYTSLLPALLKDSVRFDADRLQRLSIWVRHSVTEYHPTIETDIRSAFAGIADEVDVGVLANLDVGEKDEVIELVPAMFNSE